ncbi:MAG: mechanosensitive ion channel family protein [Acidobacteria bacterium]|nr:mechanosensitive ion channel family protein [Acidobacteriota bacterium]
MEQINKFWQVVVDVWEQGLWGIDIGRIIVALLIFFIFLFLRQLLARFIINRLKAIAGKTKFAFDDEIVEALQKPFTFIPVILGFFFATEFLFYHGTLGIIPDQTAEAIKTITGKTESLESLVDKILRSLVVYVIFWSMVRLVQPLSFLFKQLEEAFSVTMVEWMLKGIRVCLVLLGAATILQLWDIQVLPLLAGMGVVSVAVALGAQDLFKNLISGLLIIGEHRFNPGDWIKVDNEVEGTVEAIGFRSTLVRRFDKAPVYVPNAKLSDNSVINFTAMTHRRIYWMITVQYCTTIEQLRKIRDSIEEFILGSDDFAKPPEVPTFVRIDSFNDSSIDIMVYCFTKTTVWGEWLAIKEKLAYRIKEIVEGAGAGFAFPSQSIYIETVPSEMAERFLPPSKE